jgi:hypothetical protein
VLHFGIGAAAGILEAITDYPSVVVALRAGVIIVIIAG